MLPIKYIHAVISRAMQGSVLLTDKLTILLVPFTTMGLWLSGARMTESIAGTIGTGIAITVLTVVLLRLIAATYFLWADDHRTKEDLRTKLSSELGRIDKAEREFASAYVSSMRSALSDNLAKALVCVEFFSASRATGGQVLPKEFSEDYITAVRRCRELINILSYDVYLRISVHLLLTEIVQVRVLIGTGADTIGAMKKIDEMKKAVFRLLHLKDGDETQRFITMLEVQGIAVGEVSPDPNDQNATKIDELGNILDDLKELGRNPEIIAELRSKLGPGRDDRLQALY